MAGFLIVEGDADDELNERLGGAPDIAWDVRSGPWEYRVRDFFLQRVFQATRRTPAVPRPAPTRCV